MQTKDAIYYGCFIAGMIIGSLTLRELGATGLVQLIGGVALGVGAGYLAEQSYGREENE